MEEGLSAEAVRRLRTPKPRRTNRALLCKWRWKFVQDDDSSLWKRLIIQKYGVSLNGWDTLKDLPTRGCSLWHNVRKTSDIFDTFSSVKIGNETNARFWTDNWDGRGILSERFPALHLAASNKQGSVREFISSDDDGFVWQIPLRRRRPRLHEALEFNTLLSSVPIPNLRQNQDELQWNRRFEGQMFSVKNLTAGLQQLARASLIPPVLTVPHKLIWNRLTPLKVQFLVWQLIHRRSPTRARLRRLGMSTPISCPLCNSTDESDTHLFFECPIALGIWNWIRSNFRCRQWSISSPLQALSSWKANNLSRAGKIVWKAAFHVGVWTVWKARNAYVFENKRASLEGMLDAMKAILWRWVGRKKELEGVLYDQFWYSWEPIVTSIM